MGSVRKRGDIYFIDYRVNGHRVRKKIGPAKKLAELALHDIEVKIAKREIGILEKDSTLEELFERFFRYSRTNHSPGTTKRYLEIVNNFRAFLKLHPYITRVEHLEPRVFEDFKTFRREGHGAARVRTDLRVEGHGTRPIKTRTVNSEVKTLRTIFNYGIKWNLVRENPTKGVQMLKTVDAAQPRFLTKEECQLLLDHCDETLRPIVLTFLNTGMRRGELLHLEWSDVDFERRVIRICNKAFWHPKTTERDIPMNETVHRTLLGLHAKRRKDTTFVFPAEDGKPYERNRLRAKLISVAKKCGLKDVTKLHALRHTFASWLVMSGVDLPTVQRLMGHADIATTMIYSHLAPNHLKQAVEKLSFTENEPAWARDGHSSSLVTFN